MTLENEVRELSNKLLDMCAGENTTVTILAALHIACVAMMHHPCGDVAQQYVNACDQLRITLLANGALPHKPGRG